MARSKSCLSVMLGLAVLVGGGFAAEPAATGQWKEDEVDETQRSEFQSKLGGVLSEGRFRPGEQEAFDDYFTKYFLPRWTVVANRDSLYQYRQELRRRLERATGVVHDHLNDLVLEFGGARVGDGGYYPAARVNFMLAIGDLNAEERAPGGIPPVPLPEALPVLIQAVESDDPAQIDGVRVAALLGILRHLDLGAVTAGDTRQAVGNAALKVLGSPRPAGRSAEGHAWLRMLAAEILGKLGDTGPNGAVATALAGLVAEPAAPFYARCTAAEALGRLDYAGATGLDASKLATALGRLALDACAAEAEVQAAADPTGEIPIVSRERLMERVNAAAIGLTGVAVLGRGTPQAQQVAGIQGPIERILSHILDTKTDSAADLRTMMGKVAGEADKLRASVSGDAG